MSNLNEQPEGNGVLNDDQSHYNNLDQSLPSFKTKFQATQNLNRSQHANIVVNPGMSRQSSVKSTIAMVSKQNTNSLTKSASASTRCEIRKARQNSSQVSTILFHNTNTKLQSNDQDVNNNGAIIGNSKNVEVKKGKLKREPKISREPKDQRNIRNESSKSRSPSQRSTSNQKRQYSGERSGCRVYNVVQDKGHKVKEEQSEVDRSETADMYTSQVQYLQPLKHGSNGSKIKLGGEQILTSNPNLNNNDFSGLRKTFQNKKSTTGTSSAVSIASNGRGLGNINNSSSFKVMPTQQYSHSNNTTVKNAHARKNRDELHSVYGESAAVHQQLVDPNAHQKKPRTKTPNGRRKQHSTTMVAKSFPPHLGDRPYIVPEVLADGDNLNEEIDRITNLVDDLEKEFTHHKTSSLYRAAINKATRERMAAQEEQSRINSFHQGYVSGLAHGDQSKTGLCESVQFLMNSDLGNSPPKSAHHAGKRGTGGHLTGSKLSTQGSQGIQKTETYMPSIFAKVVKKGDPQMTSSKMLQNSGRLPKDSSEMLDHSLYAQNQKSHNEILQLMDSSDKRRPQTSGFNGAKMKVRSESVPCNQEDSDSQHYFSRRNLGQSHQFDEQQVYLNQDSSAQLNPLSQMINQNSTETLEVTQPLLHDKRDELGQTQTQYKHKLEASKSKTEQMGSPASKYRPFTSQSRVMPTTKVMMHVNQFVHPAERIPRGLEKTDLDKWAKINHSESNKDISVYLDKLVDSFKEMLGDDPDDRVNRFTAKAQGKVSMPDSPEEERIVSYELFRDDLDRIHKVFATSLRDALKGEQQVVKEFAQERAWLRDELEFYKQKSKDLKHQIDNLHSALHKEREHNLSHFIDDHVTKLCDRAYYSYQHMQSEEGYKLKNTEAIDLKNLKSDEISMLKETIEMNKLELAYEQNKHEKIQQVLQSQAVGLKAHNVELKEAQKAHNEELYVAYGQLATLKKFNKVLKDQYLETEIAKYKLEQGNKSTEIELVPKTQLTNLKAEMVTMESTLQHIKGENQQLNIEVELHKNCIKEMAKNVNIMQDQHMMAITKLENEQARNLKALNDKLERCDIILKKVVLSGDKFHYFREVNELVKQKNHHVTLSELNNSKIKVLEKVIKLLRKNHQHESKILTDKPLTDQDLQNETGDIAAIQKMLDTTPIKQILVKTDRIDKSGQDEEDIPTTDLIGLMMYYQKREQVQFRPDCQMCYALVSDPFFAADHAEHRRKHQQLDQQSKQSADAVQNHNVNGGNNSLSIPENAMVKGISPSPSYSTLQRLQDMKDFKNIKYGLTKSGEYNDMVESHKQIHNDYFPLATGDQKVHEGSSFNGSGQNSQNQMIGLQYDEIQRAEKMIVTRPRSSQYTGKSSQKPVATLIEMMEKSSAQHKQRRNANNNNGASYGQMEDDSHSSPSVTKFLPKTEKITIDHLRQQVEQELEMAHENKQFELDEELEKQLMHVCDTGVLPHEQNQN